MVVGGWRIARSLQGGSVVCGCLVRLVYHLLVCTGRWSFFPLAGLLLVDWGWPVRRPVSDSDEHRVCSGCSMDKKHASSVLLMGLKFEVSLSNWVSAVSFILVFLHCGRWRRTGLRQQRSAAATRIGCSGKRLQCIFFFTQRCPVKGMDVIVLYQ
jgi:hypothetical protein